MGEKKEKERNKRWERRRIVPPKKRDYDKEWRGKMETSFVLALSLPFPFSLFLFFRFPASFIG